MAGKVPSLIATPTPLAKPERLKNLNHAADASGELKEDVVDPLRSSVALSGNSAVGLGVAGSALGGVHGLGTMLKGVRAADPELVIAGAADTTTSLAGLSALGIIGGARWLAPIGGGFMLIRSLQRIGSESRSARIDGMADGLAATALIASAVHGPVGLTLALGVGATLVGGMRGLHRLHLGHALGDHRLKIRGTGEIAASLGLATLMAGSATGAVLVFAGAGLGLLQRVAVLRPHVDRVVNHTDRFLYPLAARSEAMLDAGSRHLGPVTDRVSNAISSLGKKAAPVLAPVRDRVTRVQVKSLRVAARLLDKVGGEKMFDALDRGVGRMRELLLPEPERDAPPELPAPQAPPDAPQADDRLHREP